MKLPEISRFRPSEAVAENSPTDAVINAVYGLAELLCRELSRSLAGRLRRRSLDLLSDAVLYGVQGMKQMGVDPEVVRGSAEAEEIATGKDAYEEIGSLQNDNDLFAYLHEFRDRMVRVPGVSGVWIEAPMFRPSEVESLKAVIVSSAERHKSLNDEWKKSGIGGPKASVAKALFEAPLSVVRIPAFTQYEHDLCKREKEAHPEFAGTTRSRGPNNTVILKVFEHPGHEGRIDSVWPDDTGIFDYIPSLARRAYAPPGYEVVESTWAHEARSAIIAWNNPDRVKASIKLPDGFSLVSDREQERLAILAREAEALSVVDGSGGAVFLNSALMSPEKRAQVDIVLEAVFSEKPSIWVHHPDGLAKYPGKTSSYISDIGVSQQEPKNAPKNWPFLELISRYYPDLWEDRGPKLYPCLNLSAPETETGNSAEGQAQTSYNPPGGFRLVAEGEYQRLSTLAREAEDVVPVDGTDGAVFVSKRFVEPKFLKQFLTLAPCFFEGAEIWIYHPKGVWTDPLAIATSISPEKMDHYRTEKEPSREVFLELIASSDPERSRASKSPQTPAEPSDGLEPIEGVPGGLRDQWRPFYGKPDPYVIVAKAVALKCRIVIDGYNGRFPDAPDVTKVVIDADTVTEFSRSVTFERQKNMTFIATNTISADRLVANSILAVEMKEGPNGTLVTYEHVKLAGGEILKVVRSISAHVTDEVIRSLIHSENYHTFGGDTVVCTLELRNGFKIQGDYKFEGAEVFNENTGRKNAFSKAFHKLRFHEEYALEKKRT